MNHPSTHDKPQHGCWADRWNPYRERAAFTPALDNGVFKQLLGGDYPSDYIDPVLFMQGCLDAPEELPCGSTLSVMTIGGFCREHYNRQPRYVTDWKAQARASAGMADLLKKILADAEAA